jgi:large subunit ribosomal protein L28
LQNKQAVLVFPHFKKDSMAKQCEITGKKTQIGGRYSNRTRATQFNPCGKIKRQANLHKKRIYVAELDKHVTIKVSTKGLRTIAKNGAYATLKQASVI